MKKQNAITLISLVVTIIILLILAGIVVSLIVKQDGILNQIEKAQLENERATVLENMKFKILNFQMEIGKKEEKRATITDLNKLVEISSDYYDEEIDVIEMNSEDVILMLQGYQFLLDENLEIIQISKNNIEYKNNVTIWLKYAGIENSHYHTVQEVSNDIDTLNEVMASDKAFDYMLKSDEILNEVLKNQIAMETLGKINRNVTKIVTNEKIFQKVKDSGYIDSLEEGSIYVPKMTSNTTPSGVASSSPYYQNGNSWAAWAAFSRNSHNIGSGTDGWYPTTSPAWIQYEFPEEVAIYRYKIYAEKGGSEANTSDLVLKCSKDGINFETVSNIETYMINQTSSYYTNSLKKAKYWKLETSNSMRVYDLQFYGI